MRLILIAAVLAVLCVPIADAATPSEGNVSKAARLVGVSRGKFYDLMERVKLQRPPKA